MKKRYVKHWCLHLWYALSLTACNSENPNTAQYTPQDSTLMVQEIEVTEGLHKKTQTFQQKDLKGKIHEITFRKGNYEETIAYTQLEDAEKFGWLNQQLLIQAAPARLDSINQNPVTADSLANMETQWISYYDSIDFQHHKHLNLHIRRSVFVPQTNCQYQQYQCFMYQVGKKQFRSWAELLGAKKSEHLAVLLPLVRVEFEKQLNAFTESAFEKPQQTDIEELRKHWATTQPEKLFFCIQSEKLKVVLNTPPNNCQLPTVWEALLPLNILPFTPLNNTE